MGAGTTLHSVSACTSVGTTLMSAPLFACDKKSFLQMTVVIWGPWLLAEKAKN
jgi:hypothetical protein